MNANLARKVALFAALSGCAGGSADVPASEVGGNDEAGSEVAPDVVTFELGADVASETVDDTLADAPADAPAETTADTADAPPAEAPGDAGADADAAAETAGDAVADVPIGDASPTDVMSDGTTTTDTAGDAVSTDTTTTDTAGDAVSTDTTTTDTASDVVSGDTTTTDSIADSISVDTTGGDVLADAVIPDTTVGDVASGDALPEASVDADGDIVDAPAPLAWGSLCGVGTLGKTCAAPSGELGICSDAFPSPVCIHTCDASPAYSLCESGAGMCLPSGSGKNVCVKKCGDSEHATCSDGSACSILGYRASPTADGGTAYDGVGACTPACTATAKCLGAGRSCDPARRACEPIGCTGTRACPTGSSCAVGGSYCQSASPTALYGACTGATTVANGCTSNLCLAATGAAGYCTSLCDTSDPAACGDGVCWTGLDIAQGASPDSGTIGVPIPSFYRIGATAGACVRRCSESRDCPVGFYCGDTDGTRACLPGALPEATTSAGAGLPGDVCHASADCASNMCGMAPGYNDGLCLRTAPTCPTGTVQRGAGSECDKVCDPTVNNACAGSLICAQVTTGGPSVCVIGLCRADSDCATGYLCDPTTARCTTALATGAKATGAPCTADAMCGGGACIAEATSPSAWPGGYCTSLCTLLPDHSDTCLSGDICTAGSVGALGDCFKLCDTTAPFSKYGTCRSGYSCAPLGDPSVGYCITK